MSPSASRTSPRAPVASRSRAPAALGINGSTCSERGRSCPASSASAATSAASATAVAAPSCLVVAAVERASGRERLPGATGCNKSRCASSRALGDVPRRTSPVRSRVVAVRRRPLSAYENSKLHVVDFAELDAPIVETPSLTRAIERERVCPGDVDRCSRRATSGREVPAIVAESVIARRPSAVTAIPNGERAGRSATTPVTLARSGTGTSVVQFSATVEVLSELGEQLCAAGRAETGGRCCARAALNTPLAHMRSAIHAVARNWTQLRLRITPPSHSGSAKVPGCMRIARRYDCCRATPWPERST